MLQVFCAFWLVSGRFPHSLASHHIGSPSIILPTSSSIDSLPLPARPTKTLPSFDETLALARKTQPIRSSFASIKMMRPTPSYVLMLLLPTAFGFRASLVLPRSTSKSGWGQLLASSSTGGSGSSSSSSSPTAEGDKNLQHHIEYNPMAGYQGVDLDRAKECAEHFGECTVDEMALLRESMYSFVRRSGHLSLSRRARR